MRETLRRIIDELGFIGSIVFIINISLIAIYTLYLVKGLSGYANPIKISRLNLFFLIFPFSIPIKTDTDTLTIFFIALYTGLALLDLFRKSYGDRPLIKTYILASFIFSVSLVIEYLQSLSGIQVGSLKMPNEYIYFVSASIAPFTEEFGFRLSFLGLASLILFKASGYNGKNIIKYLKSIVYPYDIHKENIGALKTLYILVMATAVLFGAAHLLGGGWKLGKFTLATIAGLFLGYVYIRYGFSASILGHAYFNIYLLTTYYLYTYSTENMFGNFSRLISLYGWASYYIFSIGIGVLVAFYFTYQYIIRYFGKEGEYILDEV